MYLIYTIQVHAPIQNTNLNSESRNKFTSNIQKALLNLNVKYELAFNYESNKKSKEKIQ